MLAGTLTAVRIEWPPPCRVPCVQDTKSCLAAAAQLFLRLQENRFQFVGIDMFHHAAKGRLAGSRKAVGLPADAQGAALSLAQAFGKFGQVLLALGAPHRWAKRAMLTRLQSG